VETVRHMREDQRPADRVTNDVSAAFDSLAEGAMKQEGDLSTRAFVADDRLGEAAPACMRDAAAHTMEEETAGPDKDASAVVAALK
jgi:hypothetical protein